MKIQIDGRDIFELLPEDRMILEHDLPAEIIDQDIERRIKYVISHKIDQCFNRMREEWFPVFMNDPNIKNIPADRKGFVELVRARPEYKTRSQYDAIAEQEGRGA